MLPCETSGTLPTLPDLPPTASSSALNLRRQRSGRPAPPGQRASWRGLERPPPARRPAPLQYSVQNKILSPALPPSSDASFRAPNATGEMSSSLTFQTAAQPGSAAPVPEPWMAIPVSRWRRLLPASSLLPEIQHAARIDPAS